MGQYFRKNVSVGSGIFQSSNSSCYLIAISANAGCIDLGFSKGIPRDNIFPLNSLRLNLVISCQLNLDSRMLSRISRAIELPRSVVQRRYVSTTLSRRSDALFVVGSLGTSTF